MYSVGSDLLLSHLKHSEQLLDYVLGVARSKQACIYVVEALLIIWLFYMGNELILIDIRKSFRSSTCFVRYSWSLSS
jgi:hypothetical protein